MPQRDSTQTGLLAVSLLTLFAFALAGYHPFVEDGGVYAAGIEKLLNPALFPTWTAFVTEHLRFSFFAPLVAGLVRVTHLSLPWTLLLLYLVSIWTTLFAAWLLATRLTPNLQARLGAVSLLACWLTLPIAGTSLMLMDPYLTARSFTTPLTLLALTFAIDALSSTPEHRVPHLRRRFIRLRWGYRDPSASARSTANHSPQLPTFTAWIPCAITLLIAATLHPLMAGYALASVLCLAAVKTGRIAPPLTLAALALTLAALLQSQAPPESPTYVQIALTRYYWFLSQWHWYELLGLIAPLLILLALRKRSTPAFDPLAETGFLLGAFALLIALLFAHESSATHLVARLQPLRAFQIVYELMILLLGAWLGTHILQQRLWRWAILLLAFGTPMFFAQRATFPNSAHIEWPDAAPRNPWQQAFLWIRAHTPTNALFALDAHYITAGRHEDAQCFRAIAQRSALPDYSKDGGEASITPALTALWATGEAAQENLETEPDALRLAKLQPLGVTWLILETTSPTAFSCPYRNLTVKVCRLP